MKALLLATALIMSTSGAALAGSGVTNRHTTRHTTGHGRVDFTNYETYSINQENYSSALKLEANFGDVNITNVKFNNGSWSGNAHSSNNRPVDPVSLGAFSESTETVIKNGVNTAVGFEVFDFTEVERTHSVESYNF